jgi:hypothetical protein
MGKELTFKERQVQEALARMKMLHLSSHCISAFRNGEIWESEGLGALYELNDNEKQIVEEFYNNNPECLVYHMIHNKFEFGECYTMLFISNYEEEWERDKKDIEDGICFTYVKNVDYEECSEFGTIALRPSFGGLIRIS